LPFERLAGPRKRREAARVGGADVNHWARNLIVFALRGYQLVFSPWLGPSCRFEPTCSEYAREAVERFGPVRGSGLAAKRILRCHPFGSHGFDPVPELVESVSAGASVTTIEEVS